MKGCSYMKETYHLFFTNLANKLKMKIVLELRKGERNVGELCDALKVEQSKVSHALSSLKCCNIVLVKKDGKKRVYSLNKETIIPILDLIDKHSTKCCNRLCKNCRK